MKTALESALILADEGRPVFPCLQTKAPACPGGFKAATSHPSRIRQLWFHYPGPLVGVPTGAESGFDVLDLDPKHNEAGAWWERNHTQIPETRMHRTRSGGIHALFRHASDLRCTTSKLALGVDTRADGGYIVWWPATGLSVLSDLPLASWPTWLLQLLQEAPTAAPRRARRPLSDRALAGLIRKVAAAPEGQRNSLLYWAGCRAAEAIAGGSLEEKFARAILQEAARRAGLPAREARGTIESALRRTCGTE